MIRRWSDGAAEIGVVVKTNDGTKHFFHGTGVVEHETRREFSDFDRYTWRPAELRSETQIEWLGDVSQKAVYEDGEYC